MLAALRRVRGWLLALAVAAAAIAVLALAHDSILTALVPRIASMMSGYQVAAGSVTASLDRIEIDELDVHDPAGEPLLRVRRIELAYTLKDLLPGSTRAYGVRAITVDAPHLTVIRHRDGTFNFTLPAPAPSATSAAPKPPPPFRMTVSVSDGSVSFASQLYPRIDGERVAAFDLHASIDTRHRTTYAAHADYIAAGTRYPIRGAASLDVGKRFAVQHWSAAALPIASLVDFAMNSTAAYLSAGTLRNVDVGYSGFGNGQGIFDEHLAATAMLTGGQLYLGQLDEPARNLHGLVRAYDDGITAQRIDGMAAGIPVVASGGLIALQKPEFRLAVVGHGELAELVTLSSRVGRLTVRGRGTFALLVEGPVQEPLVFATLGAPHLWFRDIPLEDTRAAVALQGTDAAVLGAGTRYGRFSVSGLGVASFRQQMAANGFVRVQGPAQALPYLAEVVPRMALTGFATFAAAGTKIATNGYVAGQGPDGALGGIFAVSPNGVGDVGPLTIDRTDGAHVYARIALDRPTSSAAGVVAVQHLRLVPQPVPPLPGFPDVPRLPIAGRFDILGAGAIGPGDELAAAGTAEVTDARIGALRITAAHARLATAGNEIRVLGAAASGPWGTLSAGGGIVGGALALQGTFRGSLDQLAQLGPGGIAATGTLDAPFALVAGPQGALLELRGAHFSAARIGGVALGGASGTIGWNPPYVTLYGLTLQAAGGRLVAAGQIGSRSAIALAARGIDARNLRAAGLVLESGSIGAVGTVTGTLEHPQASAGIALEDGRYHSIPLTAGLDLAYDGTHLSLDHSSATVAGAWATLSGGVAGVSPHALAPRYDLTAHVHGLSLAQTAAAVHAPLRYPEGSADADLQVSGRASAPAVSGEIAIPVGAINGLAFEGARTAVQATTGEVRLEQGTVTVGTSRIAFSADVAPASQAVSIDAPAVDLADFNDYFDRAETLGGQGRIALAVHRSAGTLATNGRLALTGVRYERLDFGTADAHWGSQGHIVAGGLAVGGSAGTLRADGTIDTAGAQRGAGVNLTASLANLDLKTWLPALGLQLPVIGYVNGSARITGRYPNLSIAAEAALQDGSFGRIPVSQLDVAVTGSGGRGTITRAVFQTPQLSATAAGTFGIGRGSPLALSVRADVPNVGTLAQAVTGKSSPVGGALDTTATITGTALAPVVEDQLRITRLSYGDFVIPTVAAGIGVEPGLVTIRGGTVGFMTHGMLSFTGNVPLRPGSYVFLGAATPLALDVALHAVPLDAFDKLLPDATKLGGDLEANVAVRGTVRDPLLDGTASVTGGSFVSSVEAAAITNMRAEVAFAGDTIRLSSFSGDIGGGSLDATGAVHVTDTTDPVRGLAYHLDARATDAVFNLPQYYSGRVDGSIALAKSAGSLPSLDGTVNLTNARIPASALYQPNAPKTSHTRPPFDVALGLKVAIGRNVRVQNGMVDVGATGAVTVGGTLADPRLAGKVQSTGGTISFYRDFTIDQGTVAFQPSNGLVPYVNAVATTRVPSPPTDVTLHVSGPATNMHLVLASSPMYDQSTILGLLVGAQNLGALNIASNGQPGTSQPSLIQNFTESYLDQQFTRQLLQPLSNTLGSALGANVNLSINPTTGLGAYATHALTKNMDLVVGQTFGYPPRQTFGVRANFPNYTGMQLIFFQQAAQTSLVPTQTFLQALASGQVNQSLSSIQPPSQGSGFVFTLQKRYP